MASAGTASEDEASMIWMANALRDVVFGSSSSPVTCVTDNQLAINNALGKVFSSAKLLLCICASYSQVKSIGMPLIRLLDG